MEKLRANGSATVLPWQIVSVYRPCFTNGKHVMFEKWGFSMHKSASST